MYVETYNLFIIRSTCSLVVRALVFFNRCACVQLPLLVPYLRDSLSNAPIEVKIMGLA